MPLSTLNPLAVGLRAPDFALRDQNGVEVTLSGLTTEKNVVIVFYPFAFSGICTGELDEIRDHLERTFAHIAPWAEQGATIVLGSGAARRTPSGVSREAAAASLADVARIGDDIAKRYGYELLLEPLNSSETDQINGFAEGVAFLDAHGLDDMRLVCDWYHLVLGGEGLDDVVQP